MTMKLIFILIRKMFGYLKRNVLETRKGIQEAQRAYITHLMNMNTMYKTHSIYHNSCIKCNVYGQ